MDATGIVFDFMNEELRIALIMAMTEEAHDAEWTEVAIKSYLQAIVRVKDGEPLGRDDTDLTDVPDEDLTDVQAVDRMIDFFFGNL